MSAIRRPMGLFRPRDIRGLLAVLIAITYLLAGALHGLHDLDVTNPAGQSEIASVLDATAGHADHHKALPGHHCHGCFSVTVAQPVLAEAAIELAATPKPHRQPMVAGIIPDPDFPPPKS